MIDSKLLVAAVVIAMLVAGLSMGLLHERHYKERRWKMLTARVQAIEEIVAEDRHT